MPRGFREMRKDLEDSERKNPLNMTDHDIQEESYNLAVQRNKNLSAFTKEQESRSQELFEESSNREFKRVYGHRPSTTTSQSTFQPTQAPIQQQQQQPTETERQAERVLDFVNSINPQHKKYGVIEPREKQEV